MLKNILKITYRNLFKNKLFSLINILGLAVGFTSSLFLITYALDELCYDRYHHNAENIYRLTSHLQMEGREWGSARTPAALGYALQKDFPEVEDFVTLKARENFTINVEKEAFSVASVYYTTPSVFHVFSFELLQGNPVSVLSQPHTIVLGRSVARRIFGEANPLGRSIETADGVKVVTGIMKDAPENSHFRPAAFLPMEQDVLTDWRRDAAFYNYILVQEGYPENKLTDKIQRTGKGYMDIWLAHNAAASVQGLTKVSLEIQKMTAIHLFSHLEFEMESNGNADLIYLFLALAGLILIIACINYINLALVRAATRAKEVGIKKVMGWGRVQLAAQFLIEALVFISISFVICLVLFDLLFPLFNDFTGKSIEIGELLFSKLFLSALLGILLIMAMAGGAYPAFFMAGFNPVSILKGNFRLGNTQLPLRKILLIFQFTISITLLIVTWVAYEQVYFMKRQKLGFDKDQVMVLQMNGEERIEKMQLLKNELLQHSRIRSVGITGQVPGGGNIKAEPFLIESSEGVFKEKVMQFAFVDHDFVPTLDIHLVAGRNFVPATATNTSGYAVLVNESLVEGMGWEKALGKRIQLPLGEEVYAKVVGVFEDFHVNSLHDAIQPLLLLNLPSMANSLLIKIQNNDVQGTISYVRDAHQKISEANFDFSFLDQDFQKQYLKDERQGQLFAVFSGISIFVSCLGIFGLSSFTTSERKREIVIRKVLGASVFNILVLLSRDYFRLSAVAFILALLFGVYGSLRWLNNYAYKVDLSYQWFIFPPFVVFFIIWAIIGYQSLKTAHANPAGSLMHE